MRRLFAGSMNGALAVVRAELGDDALILETRSVPGGVEVTAAAEGRSQRPLPERGRTLPAHAPGLGSADDVAVGLQQGGLDAQRARELAADLPPDEAVQALAVRLPVAPLPLPVLEGRFAFVGPPGAGKTTTIAKLIAGHALARGGDDAVLVTLDTVRPAAAEQLRGIARILSVPVLVARDAGDVERMLRALSGRSLVLIDTPGIAPSPAALAAARPWLDRFADEVSVALVSSFAYARSYQGRVFETLAPHADVVVPTHLDDALSLGELIDCAWHWRRPLAWLGSGADIPDDLLRPDRIMLAARLLGVDAGGVVAATGAAAGVPA